MRNCKWAFPALFVLWVIFLFFLSSQSYEEQSMTPVLASFDTPFWYELFAGISFMYGGSEVSVQSVGVAGFLEFFIRKGAHLFIFFVLGFLYFGVWRVFEKKKTLAYFAALSCVIFLAITDEVHQLFTDGRTNCYGARCHD